MELIQQNAPTSCKETHWILESGGFDVLATVGNIESDLKKDRELAVLFAAAPDLLAACKAILLAGEHVDIQQGMQIRELFPNRFKAIDNAIAKAEGV